MTRLFKIIASIALLAVAASCSDLLFEDRDQIYDGPPVVEFGPTLPAGSYSQSVTFPADSDQSTTVSIRVNYIAAPPESSINGSFQVSGGDAVDGTHYSLPEGTTFTIPAGENSTDIQVQLLGSGLSNGESVSLTLELQEGQDYEVSANYKEFQISASKES